MCLARSDTAVKKRQGLTYFIVDLHAPGVTVRPLRHLGGEIDFNEVFLDDVRIPDSYRIGAIGDGWRVAGSSLAGERQMVSGAGSGGVDRIGGRGIEQVIARAGQLDRTADPAIRQRLMAVNAEERIRAWTNQRVRAMVQAGGTPGPAASIGKVHQGTLNQQMQMVAADLLGADALAWEAGSEYQDGMPHEVRGHAAIACQHHRRWDDRSEQEHPRRTGPRPSSRTRSVGRRALGRGAALMTSYEHLIVERHGPVGWLINNRPDQLNAMNSAMRDEFALAWRELDDDPDVRVIVHTGNGRAFQTGADVSEMATDGVGMERYRESVEQFDLHFTAWHQQVWKPVITAVNGSVRGGGVPLGRRRRHRDRRERCPVLRSRTCRSGRSWRSRPSGSCARCRSRP